MLHSLATSRFWPMALLCSPVLSCALLCSPVLSCALPASLGSPMLLPSLALFGTSLQHLHQLWQCNSALLWRRSLCSVLLYSGVRVLSLLSLGSLGSLLAHLSLKLSLNSGKVSQTEAMARMALPMHCNTAITHITYTYTVKTLYSRLEFWFVRTYYESLCGHFF